MALRLAGERYPSEGIFDTVTITDGAGHYLQVPKLTTAQRDALSPVNGKIIYNTTTGQFEGYDNGWGGFGGGVSDHGALTGLGDDDHSQYLNNARHDTPSRHTLGTVVPHDDHGALGGLGDDDHPLYFLADGTRSAAKVVIADGTGHYLQVPKLTTAQRDALTPVNGMLIYNSTTNQFERYQNGAWGAFGGGGAQTYFFFFTIEPTQATTTSTSEQYSQPMRSWKAYHNMGNMFSGKTITSVKLHWALELKTNNASYKAYGRLRVTLPDPADWKYTQLQETNENTYTVFRGTIDITPTSWVQNGKAALNQCVYSEGGGATAYIQGATVFLEIVAE